MALISRLAVVERQPPPAWDDVLRRLGGSIFHSTIWAAYQEATQHLQPVYLLAHDADDVPCAGALAFLRQSRRPLLANLLCELEMPAHPFVSGTDPDLAAAFMVECERWARTRGCSRLALASYFSAASHFVPAQHGYVETSRWEFMIDLTAALDALWRAVGKDHRERIRRLGREGVSIDLGTSPADLQNLQMVREATQSKRASRGQAYDLHGDEALYANLWRYLLEPGAACLLVARLGGEPLAALFLGTFNGAAYSIFSGSTDRGYALGAQSAIFWAAVERFKADGLHTLNRGGVPAAAAEADHPLHGIYRFKHRLGTTPRLCRSGRKVLLHGRDQLLRLRDVLRGAAGEA